MISVVINADTRIGYKEPQSTVGDYGAGSLQGVRSIDFLTEGVKNKMNYFRGHDCQCVLYIDKHEDIEPSLMQEIESIVYSYGNNSKVIFKDHDRTRHRWNDYLYIEALKLAEGDYVVHFDNDANAFRTDDADVIEKYFYWLDNGYKYICQPSDLTYEQHGMYWASSRFFICKRETLDLRLIERYLFTPLNGKHSPCFEHAIGILAGEGTVLYPPRDDDKYIVFSWARYFGGTLQKLNSWSYDKVKLYLFGEDCVFAGANDLLQNKRIEI